MKKNIDILDRRFYFVFLYSYMSLALVLNVHSNVDWHLLDEQQSGSRQSIRPSK